ncbi:hypothetical protein ACEWY4_017851 [Coilia grayii]|uniref:Zinc finger MYM-type protein 1 n=1 Tax=Coilia grayii TaxID=363190 RepID=A0ABD1JI08_9TELE
MCETTSGIAMNSIEFLSKNLFERLSLGDKLAIKQLGPDKPDIQIAQPTKDRGKTYIRTFSRGWYEKKKWLCGCFKRNTVFCFPCLLFRSSVCTGQGDVWSTTGVCDLKHFSERAKKHEQSKAHLQCAMKLAMLGQVNIATQLDEGYHVSVRNHNKEVDNNRHILSKLIDCIKFCGAFELALRGHDESGSSENPGVFLGLVDLVASLDSAMRDHLDTATVFKGTSNRIKNELLDCMLDVMQGHIIQDLKNTDFLAVQADETTDVSTHCQFVIVFRYIDKANTLQERFFSFKQIDGVTTAEAISKVLLQQLGVVCSAENDVDRERLIAQTFDGASVMRGGTGGVRRKIQDLSPNAHFIHCYAHQLNLVMQQAVSSVASVRGFFSDICGFCSFFSRSPKRTATLDNIVARRLPRISQMRWNFHSRAVSTVYENKDVLLECFKTIRESPEFDSTSIREANGYCRMLTDKQFLFFLELFNTILSRVDILFAQLQRRQIDIVHGQRVLENFVNSMANVRDSVPSIYAQYITDTPQRGGAPNLQRIGYEVCDTVIANAKDRFQFTGHLAAAVLVDSARFPEFAGNFPKEVLAKAIHAYPVLNNARLQTELGLIYENPDFRAYSSAMALFQLFCKNNLMEVFSETLKLLRIIITTPMTTAESERCFSTLKRIKTFLRNTMAQDRLNALAMLSIEKRLTHDIPDFNRLVIEKFAHMKDRRAKFLYK